MKNALLIALTFIVVMLLCKNSNGATFRDGVSLHGNGSKVSSVCIEGHVFVIAYGSGESHGYDNGFSYVPSIIQVYEEKDGKVVPMKCK